MTFIHEMTRIRKFIGVKDSIGKGQPDLICPGKLEILIANTVFPLTAKEVFAILSYEMHLLMRSSNAPFVQMFFHPGISYLNHLYLITTF